MGELSFLERLFPRWAGRREYYRQMLIQSKRNYKAAQVDRLSPWVPVNASAEQTDSSYRDRTRARGRDIERNSELGEAILGALLRNAINTGIKPQAKVRNRSGKLNKKLNRTLEEKFKKFVRECDITGQLTFYELQEMAARRKTVDGEILVRKITDPNAEIPLKLQMIEADLIGSPMFRNAKTDKHIVGGIEVDDFYKPLAYWVRSRTPDDFIDYEPKSIPADQIIHLFKKTRPSQVRGMSELARVIPAIKATEDYLDAELVAARIAASFSVFVTSLNPGNTIGRSNENDKGQIVEKIEPGLIQYLKPGESVEMANPGRNNAGVSDYIKMQERRSAAAMGLSYEVVSRDMMGASYSSARQNLLEDRKTWIPAQRYMIEHFCQPIWREFVKACVLAGLVKIPDFWNDPERYYACDWVAPGWTWIDPIKDVRASKEEVKSGFKTIAQITAEQGGDWQEILEQLAREEEYANSLGLNLDIFGGVNDGSKQRASPR